MKGTRHSRMKKELREHLGAVLREARLKREWTQADVAERVGVATDVYGRMERGHMTPSVLNLRRLCEVLRLGADAALGLEPHETSTTVNEEPAADGDPPRLRRLLRTLRQLDGQQLAAIGAVARGFTRPGRSESAAP